MLAAVIEMITAVINTHYVYLRFYFLMLQIKKKNKHPHSFINTHCVYLKFYFLMLQIKKKINILIPLRYLQVNVDNTLGTVV